jgi:hypothetical protein
LRVQDRKLVAFSVSESAFSMSVPAMPESPLSREQRTQLVADARQARLERERAPIPAKAEPVKQTNQAVADEDRKGAIILRGPPRVTAPKEPGAPALEPKPTSSPEAAATTATPAVPPLAEVIKPATAELPKTEPVATQPTPEKPDPTLNPDPAGPAAGSKPTETARPLVLPAKAEEPKPGAGPGAISTGGVTNASPVAAVTVPARTWFTAGGLFVAGLCFFVVAALLSWVLLRRARTASGPSYITRSIDDRR